MKHTSKGMAVNFTALVLLVVAVPATASGFCFSFGSKSNNTARYSAYPPPYPGVMAPVYPVYGYSQAPPAYNYGANYYPLPPPITTMPSAYTRK